VTPTVGACRPYPGGFLEPSNRGNAQDAGDLMRYPDDRPRGYHVLQGAHGEFNWLSQRLDIEEVRWEH
jgi:hypothetical protein